MIGRVGIIHEKVLGTADSVFYEFRQDRLAALDGKIVSDDRLFREVQLTIKKQLIQTRKQIVAYTQGNFEYEVTPTSSGWSSDFSIPFYFNVNSGEKAIVWIYMPDWGTELSIEIGQMTESRYVYELFEIRGPKTIRGEYLVQSLMDYQSTYEFKENPVSEDIHKAGQSRFHRFDLALTEDGQKFLAKYAEVNARKNGGSEIFTIDAQILVQVTPDT